MSRYGDEVLKNCGEGKNQTVCAADHYSAIGRSEGRYWDCDGLEDMTDEQVGCYLIRYHELLRDKEIEKPEDAKRFYKQWGITLKHDLSCEGLEMLTDEQAHCYLDRYDDLADDFGPENYAAARRHWIRHGKEEGRKHTCEGLQELTEEQALCYLERYDDIAKAFGPKNINAAKRHFKTNGFFEKRDPYCDRFPGLNQTLTDAQAKCYLERYPDLQAKLGKDNLEAAKSHYTVYGFKEHRSPNCGEPLTEEQAEAYANRYPDLAKLAKQHADVEKDYKTAYLSRHYYEVGQNQGRNKEIPPRITDTQAKCYLERNPDL